MNHYISTAIPYVNASPHVGFAFEAVLADTLARYLRSRGVEVWHQSGTDENSLKNVAAARIARIAPDIFVARNAARYSALQDHLGLGWDTFLRTSSPDHHRGVQKFWRALQSAGDLYWRRYRGAYCPGCEQFYSEEGRLLCPEHRCALEVVEEQNFFFRLSRYRAPLLELIRSNALEIQPEHARRETLALLDRGLEDISVSRVASRAFGWGVPVPDSPEQVIYVWLDALVNYLTGLGFGSDERDTSGFRRFWLNGQSRIHVIGKGVLKFHALLWPALLLSAKLPLPTRILVHGYLTLGGRKISKSLGNTVSPAELSACYGPEALRYYLLRHHRAQTDGDFSEERLSRARQSELCNSLGNLLNRVIQLLHKNGGIVPNPLEHEEEELALIQKTQETSRIVERSFARFELHSGLDAIFGLVSRCNHYLQTAEPWRGGPRAAHSLYVSSEVLRLLSALLRAYLPKTSGKIRVALGLSEVSDEPETLRFTTQLCGLRVQPGPALFRKLIEERT